MRTTCRRTIGRRASQPDQGAPDGFPALPQWSATEALELIDRIKVELADVARTVMLRENAVRLFPAPRAQGRPSSHPSDP
jgi:hypothetical protein